MKLSTRGAAKASEFLKRNMTAVTAAVMLLSLMGYLIVDSAVFSTGCHELYDGVLRLHILANSDTQQDQQLKLRVRDRILLEAEQMGLGEGCTNAEETAGQARRLLPQLVAAAQDELAKHGSSHTVSACVTRMYFNTRTYEGFTMPAGEYRAVRFTIGEGRGHNWWCVLFPQMCLPPAFAEPEQPPQFSRAQLRVLSARPQYEPRFALLELLHRQEALS
ncbi:MAG: stage II sporulation protein R [Negativibacillus sp.]|nr:stage II sporulation protein R [Negativibacillus sp.]